MIVKRRTRRAVSFGAAIHIRQRPLLRSRAPYLRFFANHAAGQRIISFDDLTRLGIGLTAPQRADLTRRLRRSSDFAASWLSVFVASKFGEASTHWRKLEEANGQGEPWRRSPCPLLLIGFPAEIVSFRAAEHGASKAVPIEEPNSRALIYSHQLSLKHMGAGMARGSTLRFLVRLWYNDHDRRSHGNEENGGRCL